MTPRPTRWNPSSLVARLEGATVLDPVVRPVRAVVRTLLRPRPVADALHGVQIGHPAHPALAQAALGSFVSAGILDLLPGPRVSSRVLVLAGMGFAAPSIATGYADWAELHEQQQRVGIVHSSTNVVALALYGGSLVTTGVRSRVLAFAGLGALTVSGFLGGHMSYRQAAGANHTEDVPHLVQPGWQDLCASSDVGAEGVPARRVLPGDVPVLVVRDQGEIRVLAERCSHLSGPLSRGTISDGCVTCPWHGSVFDLADGAVVHGPATSPQPAFETRVVAGRLEVRLPGAG